MSEAVVAREEELERIRRSVVDVHALPAAMVLEGEAGIGKTALWRAGIKMAKAAGFLVLRATPSEAETQLAFAAAADLLTPVGDDALRNLPDVQRQALAGAVFLEAPGVADRRAVATAFLGALRHLAETAPVLVAADDTQWLDADSALLLSFAARRLTSEPIGFLLARRPEGDKPQVDLGEAVERLQIEPLSLGALGRLIHARIGAPIARPLLRRIHEVSGGNPFFALELAAAADRNAAVHDVALPESLEALVDARLRRLTPETRVALAELAAMPDLSPRQHRL